MMRYDGPLVMEWGAGGLLEKLGANPAKDPLTWTLFTLLQIDTCLGPFLRIWVDFNPSMDQFGDG